MTNFAKMAEDDMNDLMKMADGKDEVREVKTGHAADGKTEILEGLEVDQVILVPDETN